MEAIKEVIVVEGRDDTAAIERAVKAAVIETHGFGIRAEVWERLENAYGRQGLIIFTDPDYSGDRIRERLSQRFPEAKQAYLTADDAEKDGDIGIENASPEAIRAALAAARAVRTEERREFTADDVAFLTGYENSAELRSRLGKELGIGGGNAKAFLKKLNRLGISREEFDSAWEKITEK